LIRKGKLYFIEAYTDTDTDPNIA